MAISMFGLLLILLLLVVVVPRIYRVIFKRRPSPTLKQYEQTAEKETEKPLQQ